jgi:hypothetical protein
MDSRRPGVVATLPARHLRFGERLKRALLRTFAVTGIGLLVSNFALLIMPVPHLHLCSIPLVLILGPLVGAVTFRDSALLGASDLPCPRCSVMVQVPAELPGWPARFNCIHCGIMVELNEAR